MRTSKAAPIQKRENRRAVMKAKATVPMVKLAKRAIGTKEMRSWAKRNDCSLTVRECAMIYYIMQEEGLTAKSGWS
jgi:hypothetical protein